MEKLEQKVCLDTDAVIAILKGKEEAVSILNKIKDYETFISSVTFFELLLRKTNLEEIEEFRNKVNIIDLDEKASRKASLIFKGLKEKGIMIDLRDIFISASCISNDCSLITFNKKHFERMKEFGLVLV